MKITGVLRNGAVLLPLAIIAGWAAPAAVHADLLILNGGFESGFANWTRADQPGSDGTFALQTGTLSPVSGDSVPAPTGGLTAAMTDALGPGSHVLYQDFIVPSFDLGSAILSFDLFIGNRADRFVSPSTLEVDILLATAEPFSVAGGDVLQNVFQTLPGDPLVSGYFTTTVNLTPLLLGRGGQTLRLRFAEVDNLFTFQLGVDNVRLEALPVPEPSALIGLATGGSLLLSVAWRARRRAVRDAV